jgi:hypothetical protein
MLKNLNNLLLPNFQSYIVKKLRMNILIKCSGLFTLLLLLSSCSPRLTPFTQKIYDEYDWTESDLKQVQFYVSQDVILKRQIKDGDAKIKGGKINIVDGKRVEEITISRGTPGLLLYLPKDQRFAVSFDEDDNKYLIFGPNKKQAGKYVLLANDWDRNSGQVTYDGKLYRTSSESAYAALMVDLKAARKISINREKATGRKLD